jgi:arylsulfatase
VGYPKAPAFKARFGPRGVIHKQGRKPVKDSKTRARLNKKRMETIHAETLQGRLFASWMRRTRSSKPFFVYYNVDAHARLDAIFLKTESQGKNGPWPRGRRTWSCSTAR